MTIRVFKVLCHCYLYYLLFRVTYVTCDSPGPVRTERLDAVIGKEKSDKVLSERLENLKFC